MQCLPPKLERLRTTKEVLGTTKEVLGFIMDFDFNLGLPGSSYSFIRISIGFPRISIRLLSGF